MILGSARRHLTEFDGAPVVSLPGYDAESAEDWPAVAIPGR
jgi:hypothetical protein